MHAASPEAMVRRQRDLAFLRAERRGAHRLRAALRTGAVKVLIGTIATLLVGSMMWLRAMRPTLGSPGATE